MYLAPEALLGLPCNEMVDVYSFGIILWECVTSQQIWKHLSYKSMCDAVVQQRQRPAIPQECPEKLAILIEDCWGHDPVARPVFGDILARLRSMGECKGGDFSFIRSIPFFPDIFLPSLSHFTGGYSLNSQPVEMV